MNALPVPQGGDQDRSGSLMAMFWTQVPIAIIVVSLRIYARFKIKAIGVDDWFMIIALVSMPPLYSSCPIINSFSDTIYFWEYCRYFFDLPWRSSSSLLLGPCPG